MQTPSSAQGLTNSADEKTQDPDEWSIAPTLISFAAGIAPVWLPVVVLGTLADPAVFHAVMRYGDPEAIFLTLAPSLSQFIIAGLTFFILSIRGKRLGGTSSALSAFWIGLFVGLPLTPAPFFLFYVFTFGLPVGIVFVLEHRRRTRLDRGPGRHARPANLARVIWAVALIVVAAAVSIYSGVYQRETVPGSSKTDFLGRALVGRVLYGLPESVLIMNDGGGLNGYVVDVNATGSTIITSYPAVALKINNAAVRRNYTCVGQQHLSRYSLVSGTLGRLRGRSTPTCSDLMEKMGVKSDVERYQPK